MSEAAGQPGLQNAPPNWELREGDFILRKRELDQLAFFSSLNPKISWDKKPGTVVLRSFKRGDVVVRLATSGSTAFVILSNAELFALRSAEVERIRAQLDSDKVSADYRDRLKSKLDQLVAEVRALERRISAFTPAGREHVARVHSYQSNRAAADPHATPLGRAAVVAEGQGKKRFSLSDTMVAAPLGPGEALLFTGDLFGERSCLNRVLRSATIVVERDCHMIEFGRDILELVRKDKGAREKMDRIYRERALGPTLRNLPFFAPFPPDLFQRVRDGAEFRVYEPGEVVCDEFVEADCLYVIRGGMAKVAKGLDLTLDPQGDFDAPKIARDLFRAREDGGLGQTIWNSLSDQAQRIARHFGGVQSVLAPAAPNGGGASQKAGLIDGLNRCIAARPAWAALGKKKADLIRLVPPAVHDRLIERAPEALDDWNDLEFRALARMAVTLVCGSIPQRNALTERTLNYRSPGDIVGEMGVMEATPGRRSASLIAYSHPREAGGSQGTDVRDNIIPSRLEIVVIQHAVLQAIFREMPSLRGEISRTITRRKEETAAVVSQPARLAPVITSDPRAESLGFMQGQRLMLIDLDRCTRCGDCVRACINTHSDGASRLYLDGPRFDRYLLPISCRSCRDPVCMIGCPVNAIDRGDHGEMRIATHCIGCAVCADNCPYGSIHIQPVGSLQLEESAARAAPDPELPAEYRKHDFRAVVCDMCASSPTGPACVYHCPHDAATRVDGLVGPPAMA